jgi:hypothetical protein
VISRGLDNSFPIRVYADGGQVMVDWCRLGDERFDEPFFQQTVMRSLRRPYNLAFRRQTPIAALGDLEASDPGLRPSGFIYHMSRCGSTLVGQMLGALEGSLVLSEPNTVDSVLRSSLNAPSEDQRVEWLRQVMSAHGRRWHGDERRLFVKLDAWHARYVPLFERAFPGVPSIFLYRDPIEVLVSHEGVMSFMMSAVNAPSFLGIDIVSAMQIPPAEYRARVLAQFLRWALDNGFAGERLVNYNELPDAVWTRIAPLFGVELTEAQAKQMRSAAGRDAKSPDRQFEPDADAKRRKAGAAVREAAARWITPLHEELEKRRLTGAAPPRTSGFA